jgi:hypothetical protein
MEPYELEILKAYSALWRNGPDSFNRDETYLSCHDPLDFLRLPETEQQDLLDWIEDTFDMDDTVYSVSSYGLKHLYEREAGNYVTNGQFKGAMIQYGYDPVDPREINSHYLVKFSPPEEE